MNYKRLQSFKREKYTQDEPYIKMEEKSWVIIWALNYSVTEVNRQINLNKHQIELSL